jgi:hypothetical protein
VGWQLIEELLAHLVETRTLPQFMRRLREGMASSARQLLHTPTLYRIRQIVITGCGNADLSVEAGCAWRTCSGLLVQAIRYTTRRRLVDWVFLPLPGYLPTAASSSGRRMFEPVTLSTLSQKDNRDREPPK